MTRLFISNKINFCCAFCMNMYIIFFFSLFPLVGSTHKVSILLSIKFPISIFVNPLGFGDQISLRCIHRSRKLFAIQKSILEIKEMPFSENVKE